MKKLLNSLATIFLTILTITFTFSPAVHASSLATPNYEVKLMMDTSKILDTNGELSSTVKSIFGIYSSENLNVQYLDTQNLALNNEGWIVRMRKFDNDDNTELTYKKRYSITSGNINAALQTAANDGFDASENNYSAQVDWGYANETLSFSNDKDFSYADYSSLNLPDISSSIEAAIDNIPGKLNKYLYKGWAQSQLNNSVLHGPYSGTRYIGQWDNLKIELEVYELNNGSSIAEISFKTDDFNQASTERQKLINTLTASNWLITSDETKTGIMLGE